MVKKGQIIILEEITYLSDWLDGPEIIDIKGGNAPTSENKINNQESDRHHHRRGKIFCIYSGLVPVSTPNGS
ncbi:AraC family transcriptional regulator, partial [Francisella tularensis subsp. holarctica]|nr:AraC family transcriptional regulator [Francisella tularensis subsp. holarctica]